MNLGLHLHALQVLLLIRGVHRTLSQLILKHLNIKCCVLITAGKYSYAEGSKYGMLSLHQLMDRVPSLHGSNKQVRRGL